MIPLNCNNTAVGPENAAPFGARLTTRRGLDSLQRGSGTNGQNGRDPAVDQEVCPDDVHRIARREVNCQLRDFQRIGDPLAWIVGAEDVLNRIALLFAWESTEHSPVLAAELRWALVPDLERGLGRVQPLAQHRPPACRMAASILPILL